MAQSSVRMCLEEEPVLEPVLSGLCDVGRSSWGDSNGVDSVTAAEVAPLSIFFHR